MSSMNFTYLKSTFIIFIASLLLFSCSYPGSVSGSSTLKKILQEKEIHTCYATWPPSVIKDPNTGELSGFLIDLIKIVGQKSGLDIVFIETTWGGFIGDLRAGRCDIGIAAFYPLIERSTQVSFTEPFLFAGNNGVKKSGSLNIDTISELNNPDITIAVLQGEYAHLFAESHLPKANLLILPDDGDTTKTFLAVKSGIADVGLFTDNIARNFINAHEGLSLLFESPYSMTPISWSVRHEDTELKGFLENAILYLTHTGSMRTLLDKYEANFLTLTEYIQEK